MGCGLSLGDGDNVLKLNSGDATQHCGYTKKI